MEESNLTIKRTYDQYDHKDFQYGQLDSTNLNPKREISFDQLDKIQAKLQEITDDIIRKKIAPPEIEERVLKAALGESLPEGIPINKQRLLAKTGGFGNALLFPIIEPGMNPGPLDILLEKIIGTFPAVWEDENDGPPSIECEKILEQFLFDDDDGGEDLDDDDDYDDDSILLDREDNQAKQGEDDDDEDTADKDDDVFAGSGKENEFDKCAEIELEWLKMLLILVKIIKMLKLLIDLVLSIIIPIIEIVQLAMGFWINPPNLALIVQTIIKIVTAIIIMLLALILQLIWNLLNLDCICDQTASIIAQIKKALGMFSSLMNSFNPTAIDMLAEKINSDVLDPINDIIGEATRKKEAWANMANEWSSTFESMKNRDFWFNEDDGVFNTMASSIAGGLMQTPEAGKASDLIGSARSLYEDSLKGALKSAADAWESIKTGFDIKERLSGISKAKGNKEAAMLGSPYFENLRILRKGEKS